jgi:hypothetical protein
MFKYRPYIDIEEIEKIHTLYEDPSIYIRYPFSKAVDGMDNTAYKSTQPIAQGDYIGLDMLLEIDRKIEYGLLYQMGDQWIKNAKLEVAGSDAVYVSFFARDETERGRLLMRVWIPSQHSLRSLYLLLGTHLYTRPFFPFNAFCFFSERSHFSILAKTSGTWITTERSHSILSTHS